MVQSPYLNIYHYYLNVIKLTISQVPSILFVPSHLVTLYTLGIPTALVVDVGFEETTMIPICEGTPLIHAWQAQPLGAKAIHE